MMASTPNKWWEEPDSHRILASEVLKLKVFKSVISKHIDKLNKMKNGEPSSVGKRGIGEIQSAEESSESDKRKKTKVCTGREKEGNKLSFDGVNFKGELLECVSSDGPSLDDVETEKDGNTELTIIHTNSEPEQPETEKKISKEMLERVNKSFFNSKEGDYSSRKKRGSHFGYFVNTFQQFITTYVVKLANAAGLRANQLANETKSTKQIICAALKTPALLQTIQCFNLLYKYNKKWSLVPIQLFYNEKINEYIEIKDDFPQYKMMDGFSFCNFPFLLSPLTKSEVIKLENTMQMRTELQDSFFHAMFVGVTCPYLLLEVRRDWLVRDTMCQLQLKSGIDLKKQLKVRFVGEEGVDEGGVQKEFFQLLVREMFDEKYGMFSYNYDTNNSWFASSMAHDSPYLHEMRLIGMVLGLSVYNSVILNIHFPSVLYKKLLGIPSNFSDLASFDPDLYNSFYKILFNSTPEEIDAIERYFEVSYTNLDQPDIYELVPNGSQIKLTYENRREFVELYLDFLFHKSCKEQFESFQKGFFSICQNSYVMTLRAEELELLVCGSSELDFEVLDKTTVYDGGYTRETNVVKNFWDIVKGFSVELKKKLLFFTTGSDRVPIGGMCKLRFVIVKNGVDSDRLPTSHTCFNALLLPEYKTYQKLEERLTTAINNSEGFGMM
ncbi:Ubiquitin-protein ligase E3A [Zancudomyces culisetae]|uniref:HECT-type E3 ubiquitin transferase n=1 Tax=Zancudomyces culisetae TaxID=1213189 RepID=A0A1R1PDU1_ZANCU|nr:Ubiquitin-protein ligase E3A [Zancudomyces culisetae]|eukprot:OMH79165.1 Ubiquitin-protein ligase E3A [Zancudomyces culisetae]